MLRVANVVRHSCHVRCQGVGKHCPREQDERLRKKEKGGL